MEKVLHQLDFIKRENAKLNAVVNYIDLDSQIEAIKSIKKQGKFYKTLIAEIGRASCRERV